MPIMKNVVGLDLGSHTVKAVELRQTLRGLEPVQMRVHPRADPEAPVAELMRRFVKMHQIPMDQVVCAVPGDRLTGSNQHRRALPVSIGHEIQHLVETVTEIDVRVPGRPPHRRVACGHPGATVVCTVVGVPIRLDLGDAKPDIAMPDLLS